jgi:iron complex transport system ATP-binding protein
MRSDSPTPLLESRGLRASYGSRPALLGVDATFLRGEIVAILGENGSGKSTLLKVIARIVPPAGGELWIDGRPLAQLPRRETARRIAYVPQSLDLVFPIRVLDLVLQGRAPRDRTFSADSPEDLASAREAMRSCDASALSGGEQRRVFLARALAQEAEIWLLDEPASGLDPRHRLEFLAILERTHRQRGTTVLFVTHEIDLAGEIADRILLLSRGRALAQGPPGDVLTRENLRRAFSVESRVEVDSAGRRRLVPIAPSSEDGRLG